MLSFAWSIALEPIKLPLILSGVCSPSSAIYCSNPFEILVCVFIVVWRGCWLIRIDEDSIQTTILMGHPVFGIGSYIHTHRNVHSAQQNASCVWPTSNTTNTATLFHFKLIQMNMQSWNHKMFHGVRQTNGHPWRLLISMYKVRRQKSMYICTAWTHRALTER